MPNNYNQRARRAIEDYLREDRPRDLDGVWLELVPESDWGMEVEAWLGVAARIIEGFNALGNNNPRIDPEEDAVQNAIRNLHDDPLIAFLQYMVDKAEGGL